MIKTAAVFDGPEREKKEENVLPGQVSDPPCSARYLPHLPVSSPEQKLQGVRNLHGSDSSTGFLIVDQEWWWVNQEAVSGRLSPLSWVLHMERGSLEASTNVPASRSFPS